MGQKRKQEKASVLRETFQEVKEQRGPWQQTKGKQEVGKIKDKHKK